MMGKRLRPAMTSDKKIGSLIAIVLLVALYIFLFMLDNALPSNSTTVMLITVLKKGAIYALVCVSMNLLNGFTGLFSLGQAGFMLIGAYAFSIFSIPAEQHASVYQYFDGGAIQFSIPEMLGNVFGANAGNFLGAIICIVIAGLVAAVFAALIGIPVLRLKSDYLAIATLGFAEIIRAIFQWNGLGKITNGSNLLRKYTNFHDIKIQIGGTIFQLDTIFPFLIATLSIVIIVLLVNSSYGRAFKSIRDDEVAAEAMGINLFKHKMLSFIISSFFAGVGGALLAMFQTTVQADSADRGNRWHRFHHRELFGLLPVHRLLGVVAALPGQRFLYGDVGALLPRWFPKSGFFRCHYDHCPFLLPGHYGRQGALLLGNDSKGEKTEGIQRGKAARKDRREGGRHRCVSGNTSCS